MEGIDGGERRKNVRLTDEEIEAVARRAAEIVEANFTLQVGKVTIRGFLYLVGVGGAAILAWLGLSGKIPFGK